MQEEEKLYRSVLWCSVFKQQGENNMSPSDWTLLWFSLSEGPRDESWWRIRKRSALRTCLFSRLVFLFSSLQSLPGCGKTQWTLKRGVGIIRSSWICRYKHSLTNIVSYRWERLLWSQNLKGQVSCPGTFTIQQDWWHYCLRSCFCQCFLFRGSRDIIFHSAACLGIQILTLDWWTWAITGHTSITRSSEQTQIRPLRCSACFPFSKYITLDGGWKWKTTTEVEIQK